MKKTNIQNNNGITICDSIVMSVKKRSLNLRKAEAIAIAAAGLIAVIQAFFRMFDFYYNTSLLCFAAIGFSLFYITLSVIEGKALLILTATVPLFVFCAYKSFDKISLGLKYAYNVIYSEANATSIDYYKRLDPLYEEQCVTTLFIFGVWLLALVIYYFTICRPNPILPLLVTFPIIEIGLYHGIEIPLFWGVIVVAYWISLLGMSTIDIGEYSGGFGGFVRKDNLFFPKRQMKLKITEKCGVFIVAVVFAISLAASAVMKLTDYKRSDSINKKRNDITNAFNEFSMDDLSSSLEKLSSAFGFNFEMQTNKLGNMASIKYKNTTDFIATFSERCRNPVYIKNNVSSVYDDNEWKSLDDELYKGDVFSDFKKYGIYPQDFPAIFLNASEQLSNTHIAIEKKDTNSSLSPYGTIITDNLGHTNDTLVSEGDKNQYYNFTELAALYKMNSITEPEIRTCSLNSVESEYYRSLIRNFCSYNNAFVYDISYNQAGGEVFEYKLKFPDYQIAEYRYPDAQLAILLEEKYSSFVYENYLRIPDNEEMDEVREAYSDVLPSSVSRMTNQDKLQILENIRNKIDDTSDYTLSPGRTPKNRDFINYFLLENHKGYCVHYATSGIILARMAGIPARYATGYIITADDFNSKNSIGDGAFRIDVKDNRSHAWAEIYLDGLGWVPFEFTSGYSGGSVSQNITTTKSPAVTTTVTSPSASTSSANGVSRTTAVRTSAASPIIMAPVSNDSGSDGFEFPPIVKKILAVIIPFASLIAFILIRRYITVTSRRRRMTTGSNSQQIGYIYEYTRLLLSQLGITYDDMQYVEFAEYAEKRAGGKYLPHESFTRMTGIALLSGFGNTPPSQNELQECLSAADKLAENVFNDTGFFRRLSLKYLKCII